MGYYLTNISISINAKSDQELAKTIEKVLSQIRENKDLNPYLNGAKKAVWREDLKSQELKSIDSALIKKLNNKK